MIKRVLMRPPFRTVLCHIPAYRIWYIKQVCIMLRSDTKKSFEEAMEG